MADHNNHRNAALGQRHAIHNWEFADTTARITASIPPADAMNVSNINKIALQIDDNSLWLLIESVENEEQPNTYITSWQAIGGSGSSQVLDGFNGDLLASHANAIIDAMEGDYVINLPYPTFDNAVDFPKGGRVEIYSNSPNYVDITVADEVDLTLNGRGGDSLSTYRVEGGEKIALTKLSDHRWIIDAISKNSPAPETSITLIGNTNGGVTILTTDGGAPTALN